MQRLLFFIIFFIFLSSPIASFAFNFSDGIKARDIGNYEEAVRIFRIVAEKGDKYAQHCLGVMLYKGLGVTRNYEESFKWLSMAAKQGLGQAQLDLGVMIFHKKGMPINFIDKYK